MDSPEADDKVTIRTVEEVLAYLDCYLDESHRRDETRYTLGFHGSLEMAKREISLAAQGRLRGGTLKRRLQSLGSSQSQRPSQVEDHCL
jgi:hypothetical protein